MNSCCPPTPDRNQAALSNLSTRLRAAEATLAVVQEQVKSPPDELPVNILSTVYNEQTNLFTLIFESSPDQLFRIEASSNGTTWYPVADNYPAAVAPAVQTSWVSGVYPPDQLPVYFRVFAYLSGFIPYSESSPFGLQILGVEDADALKALADLGSGGSGSDLIFGREYLSYFHDRLIQAVTTGTVSTIVMSGDSTTAGGGEITSPYHIWELIPAAAERRGLRGVVAVNRGQSGQSTNAWVSSYLAGDMALNPDLLVVRWGINDPFYGRTPAQFETSLRQGLATIRSSRNVGNLSILLCSPNATNDSPNGRDAAYYEAIVPMIKKAARDYKCCFIDIYNWCLDAPAANSWMDNPYGDGRHIHPLNRMNTWIADLHTQAIFPPGLCDQIGDNGNYNISGFHKTRAPADPITAYPRGFSQFRANAFAVPPPPCDGIYITYRQADDTGFQILYPYKATEGNDFFTRIYGEGVWRESIRRINRPPTPVAPAAGFTLPAGAEAMGVQVDGQLATGIGYVLRTAGTPIPAGTTICTVPFFNSVVLPYAIDLASWDGSTLDGSAWNYIKARINGSGQVVTQQAVTHNSLRVYFGPSTWNKGAG